MTDPDIPYFLCYNCCEPWYVPPEINCPRCGPGIPARPPPEIYDISQIIEPHPEPWKGKLLISAHLRDRDRLHTLRFEHGVTTVVDVSSDPHQDIVWRPDSRQATLLGLRTYQIDGLKDVKEGGFPTPGWTTSVDHAISAISTSIDRGENVLLHCAAGLRRSPTLAYAYLRTLDHSPETAWKLVERARRFVRPHEPYLENVENWLRTRPSIETKGAPA